MPMPETLDGSKAADEKYYLERISIVWNVFPYSEN
jgi:hypothetical protein